MGTGRKWRPFGTMAGRSGGGDQRECSRTPRRYGFTLEYTSARKVITKNKNWNAPGPDKIIANVGRKKACTLQEGVSNKQTPIPNLVQFSSENQHPTTCLNIIYKWFTSCLLKSMNHHLGSTAWWSASSEVPERNAVELLTTSLLIEWCVKTVVGGSEISVWRLGRC